MRPSRIFRLASRRRSFATLVVLILTLSVLFGTVLAACGSLDPSVGPGPASVERPIAPFAAVPTAAPAAAAPVAPAPQPAVNAGTADTPAATSQATTTTVTNLPPLDRMVIRNVKLSLQVQDVEKALQKVREVASAGGGYVTASHTSIVQEGKEDRMVADVTITVRSDVYDRSVQSVRQIASKVESEDGTSQDVTEEYVDLDANLRNLQASEASILKLTEQATKLDDVLTLERELANVRGQIERIQGRKQFLERKTDMATIEINLHLPPIVAPPPPEPGWNPVLTFERGWKASLIALETVADLLIGVVSFSWWLIPFGVAGVYLVRRRRGLPPTAT